MAIRSNDNRIPNPIKHSLNILVESGPSVALFVSADAHGRADWGSLGWPITDLSEYRRGATEGLDAILVAPNKLKIDDLTQQLQSLKLSAAPVQSGGAHGLDEQPVVEATTVAPQESKKKAANEEANQG